MKRILKQILFVAFSLFLLTASTSATDLQNIETVTPYADQDIQVTGDIDMNSNNILTTGNVNGINLDNPGNALTTDGNNGYAVSSDSIYTDELNTGDVDTRYVNKGGDEITGDLEISGDSEVDGSSAPLEVHESGGDSLYLGGNEIDSIDNDLFLQNNNDGSVRVRSNLSMESNAIKNINWPKSDQPPGSTDDQTLSIDGDQIKIENANSITAPYASDADQLDGVQLSSIDWGDTDMDESDVSKGNVGLGSVRNVDLNNAAGDYLGYNTDNDNFNVDGSSIQSGTSASDVGLGSVENVAQSGMAGDQLSWDSTNTEIDLVQGGDSGLNADQLDGSEASAFQEDLQNNDCGSGSYIRAVADDGTVTCESDSNDNTQNSEDTVESYVFDTDNNGNGDLGLGGNSIKNAQAISGSGRMCIGDRCA